MAQDQIKSVQGTEDLFPDQWAHWRTLYATARRLFERYGYGEIRTPVFEDTRLFVKGTGETTDIVRKQMYSIPAGEGESITLCPEGTPSVVRAYLQANLHKQEPFQKFYYIGPMFRRERPQRGRLRQFHQLGVEAVGSGSPLLDAETIVLAVEVFRQVGLTDFGVVLNSIGCPECRPRYRDEVCRLLSDKRDELCEDCKDRLQRNVLRVLDCKEEGCRRLVAGLPAVVEYLCDACAEHYEAVKAALGRAGVEFTEDPGLVRGLDYYVRTVYEIKHGGLGARDAICGGGRYDGLMELLGGPPLPCLGFAIGAEATILAMESELGSPADSAVGPAVYVVCFDEAARADAFELVQALRCAEVRADMDFEGRSAKSQMRMANKRGVRFCFLLGPDELQRREVTIKDMADGRQWSVPRDGAVQEVGRLLGAEEAEGAP
ncbi:MAG: histidine--tRNA ligase [Candidatus Brocadiae bacterium]|nr:histidine--tRNA ligase [Candidatus Brocadiia bacterium]